MLLALLAFVAASLLVWIGADKFVDGAVAVARILGISELVVGLTIVAMGTSAPELVVSVIAALQGSGEVALGNVVGSNVFNLGVILGIAILIHPLPNERGMFNPKGPLLGALLALAGVVTFMASMDLRFSRVEGLVMLGIMAVWLTWLILTERRLEDDADEDEEAESEDEESLGPVIFWLMIGMIMVMGGGQLFVWGAHRMADAMGGGLWLVASILVAAGTSAPELITTVIAARKGRVGLVVGGLVGSDIFNMLLVLGAASAAANGFQIAQLQLDAVTIMAVSLGLTLVMLRFMGTAGRWMAAPLLLQGLGRWAWDISKTL